MTREELVNAMDEYGEQLSTAAITFMAGNKLGHKVAKDESLQVRDRILAAFDALAAERGQWRDIESAPNSQKLLLWNADEEWYAIGGKWPCNAHRWTDDSHTGPSLRTPTHYQLLTVPASSPTAPRVPSAEVVSVPRELLLRAHQTIVDNTHTTLYDGLLADLRKFIAEDKTNG